PNKQIIIVDDGSADDTYRYIRSVQKRYPDELEVYRFKRNRGKREAMARGVRKSRGEILIFIDSDTVVDQDALKYLAAPFEDTRVGGVTGKVKVKNKNTNLLTRMLSVRYVMSFDFYRSSRSAYGGVMCLSGVISAYRKDILDEIVPEWLEQEFMGSRCTFGDDRSLTNYILKSGYNTVYSRKAKAMTIVPETVPKLMRMLTRWNKSFIRESLIMLGYLVKPENLRKRKMLLFDFIMTSFMTIFIVFVVSFMVFRIMQDMFLTLNFIGSISLMSMIYMAFYIRTERDWYFLYGIIYSFFYMFVLIWILPYALFTIKRNSWGTR
ncbi:MAG: glycosyltransferase, partial [Planctomycetota bacterium]